ncbi:hypothetical protein GW17_00009081 [Ensete ventricosum]|nr:hypothetical protein GW17_00009081 [Ensete ventricosum]
MLLWIASFWFVGSWIIPFLAHAAGFSKESLTHRGQALYSLLTDVAEGLAGVAILHRCLARFRPLPSGWFQFSLKGCWHFDVALGCLLFPLVNFLSQININLVPVLPAPPVGVSSVEQSILARDPVAMALYAVVVSVCAPVWEEIVFHAKTSPPSSSHPLKGVLPGKRGVRVWLSLRSCHLEKWRLCRVSIVAGTQLCFSTPLVEFSDPMSSGGLAAADLDVLRPRCWDPAVAEEGIDHFDRLPDSVLLVVFNRVGDIKALGRCCIVSRRFHAIVRLVDDILVRVDCVVSDEPSLFPDTEADSAAAGSDKPRGVFSHLARVVLGGLVKPLHALGQLFSSFSSSLATADAVSAAARKSASPSSSSSTPSSDVSHHSPAEVLKNFKEIRRLRIELPDGELGVEDGVLLKWKADFGSTLESCVTLGASSVALPSSISPNSSNVCGGDDCRSIPESFYNDGSLKRRVAWTISSLIAASARHYLLHPIVADHETLESLDLIDADGQGVLTMDRRQLQDLKMKPWMALRSSQRTLLPALSMRLWYADQLELPNGMVLRGATLLAIRPSEEQMTKAGFSGSIGSSDNCWVSDAFEEPYKSATRILMRRRTYCLEMNSF